MYIRWLGNFPYMAVYLWIKFTFLIPYFSNYRPELIPGKLRYIMIVSPQPVIQLIVTKSAMSITWAVWTIPGKIKKNWLNSLLLLLSISNHERETNCCVVISTMSQQWHMILWMLNLVQSSLWHFRKKIKPILIDT